MRSSWKKSTGLVAHFPKEMAALCGAGGLSTSARRLTKFRLGRGQNRLFETPNWGLDAEQRYWLVGLVSWGKKHSKTKSRYHDCMINQH